MTGITNLRIVQSWKCDEGFNFTFRPIMDSVDIEKNGTGYKVKYLTIDESPTNPRDWENMGIMVCLHRNHILGDKTQYRISDFTDFESLQEKIKQDNNVAVIFPLFIYDHSGLRISINPFDDKWDSGQIGFIFVTNEKILKEFRELSLSSIEKASNILKSEVESYDQYLSGDVYCTVVETYDDLKNNIDYDICGGYYGYDHAIKSLKEI